MLDTVSLIYYHIYFKELKTKNQRKYKDQRLKIRENPHRGPNPAELNGTVRMAPVHVRPPTNPVPTGAWHSARKRKIGANVVRDRT
ncbi:MAG TPA: hypothetical protein VJH96_00775, partial [Patescibacteria group bacterium]|nr:hypothetical protein [Patescibacteria group bacterium]